MRDDSEMPLRDLLHPTDAVIARGDRGKYLVEAHRRLTQPLTTMGFHPCGPAERVDGRLSPAGRPLAAARLRTGDGGAAGGGVDGSKLATRHPALIGLMWLQALAPYDNLRLDPFCARRAGGRAGRAAGAGRAGHLTHALRPDTLPLYRPAIRAVSPRHAFGADPACHAVDFMSCCGALHSARRWGSAWWWAWRC